MIKNMIIKKIFPIVCAVLAFGSCEKVIDFDPGEIDPYVVMVSKPQADSLVTVYLSYSHFFLEDASFSKQIENGAVVMEVNGVPIPGTFVESIGGHGYYSINVCPQPGDSLRLTATVPGYDKIVTAATCVPARPQMEITDYIIDTTESYYSEWDSLWYHDYLYFKIKVKVKNCGPKDYYTLSLKTPPNYSYGAGNTSSEWDTNEANMETVYFEVNDPIVNTQNLEDVLDGYDGSFSGGQMAFSSEDFVDGEHEFSIEFTYYNGYSNNGKDITKIPVLLKISSVSQELYLYEKTTSQQSDLDDLFGEPVQVYCNIEGGIGIFGGKSVKREFARNPRFEQFNHSNGYYYKK